MNGLRTHIEKNEIAQLPDVVFNGRIFVIDTVDTAEKAVNALKNEKIVGVDTETRPSFKKGVQHKVALLQISTSDTCFLFRLSSIGLPDCIINFLQDVKIKKVGLSLHDDYLALKKRKPFVPKGFIELQEYVTGFNIKDMSLQKIFALLFAKRISKSQQLTNWEADILNDKQKLYAATDAWACLEIYEHLQELSKTFINTSEK